MPLAEKARRRQDRPAADVENVAAPRRRFSPGSRREWGRLDFLVHAIAFSDKAELKGRYVDTSSANFSESLAHLLLLLIELTRRACR